MKGGLKYLSSFLLVGALAAPLGVVAQDHDHDRDHDRKARVYDRDHRDYHDWDAKEDNAYRRWRTERHEDNREYKRLSARQQREYWMWRHEHSDHDHDR